MKIETILGAMQFAQTQSINLAMLERLDPYSANMVLLGRRERQWQAFRDRILRTFEQYEIYHGFHMGDVMMIETIKEKDEKIDKLMELAVIVDRLRKQRMNTDYLDAMDMAKEILKCG